jgi:hypothetical protein
MGIRNAALDYIGLYTAGTTACQARRILHAVAVAISLGPLGACALVNVEPLPQRSLTAPAGLESAPAPAGIDAALWVRLKAALREALAQPQPGAGEQEVGDLVITVTGTQQAGATARFAWTYVNGGDYDQNGEVNIGDLTPLGLNFGKTAQSPDWAAAQMADGDGNGEINIADVTPIGVNFGGRVEGYRLQSADSPDASAWADVSTAQALLAGGVEPPGGGPIGFTLDLPDPADGLYYRVEPYAARARGAGSNPVLCEIPLGALPPQAQNTATPESGPAPLTATFDASASFDPDGGSITHYEWDVDGIPDNGPQGDGFEISGGAEPTMELMWYSLGQHQVRVRVTDDEGATDIEAHSVSTTPGASWHVSMPEADEFEGQSQGCDFTPLEVGGLPALIFVNKIGALGGGEETYCVKSEDEFGGVWAAPVHVLTPNTMLVLACASGGKLLYISGFDSAFGMFQLTTSTNGGESWAATEWAGPTGPGLYPRILISGNPAPLIMAVTDDSNGVLYCVSATDAFADAWAPPMLLPLPSADYGRCQAAIIGGTPCLAIHDQGKGNLLYCRSGTAAGSSWADPVTVDYDENVGASCSLIQLAGRPVIAYYNDTQRRLMIVRALDPGGVNWGIPQVVDSDADDNIYLALLNERPALVYTMRDSPDICFRQAVDAEALVWDEPLVIDSGAIYISSVRPDHNGLTLQEIAGHPACVYSLYEPGPPQVYRLRYASLF